MFAYCNSNPVVFVDPTERYQIYYDELISYARCFLAGLCDLVSGTMIRDMKDSLLIRQAQAGLADPSLLFEKGIITVGCKFVGSPVMPVEGGSFRNDYPLYEDPEYGYHGARDIGGLVVTDVYAAFGGKVVASETHWSYGTNIVIETIIDGKTYRTIYAHLTEGSVNWDVGSYVNAGDKIGTIGLTGNTSGGHVHFEMRGNDFTYRDDNIDPRLFF